MIDQINNDYGYNYLLVKETNLPQVTDKLYQIIIPRTAGQKWESNLQTLVVIDAANIGRCKSKYHSYTTTSVLYIKYVI